MEVAKNSFKGFSFEDLEMARKRLAIEIQALARAIFQQEKYYMKAVMNVKNLCFQDL
ncbi:MAG TPA: hypothetical protein GXX37_04080 [Clostridiaceae bacterium]|nr:hypothetical protein [Clostridiaceae bacterium]